jgi:hypothetical protein
MPILPLRAPKPLPKSQRVANLRKTSDGKFKLTPHDRPQWRVNGKVHEVAPLDALALG